MRANEIMYSQLQNWSTCGGEPCMEQTLGPPISHRVGNFHQTPKNHPWRPTLGYENIQVTPLPGKSITSNMVEGCGLSTEPLKFPNLVTGFERDPSGAARAALYTRYTPYEWTQNNIKHYNESDANRSFSERTRADASRIMRETEEMTNSGQREVGRRLGERLCDLAFWKNELTSELEKMIQETTLLNDSRRMLEKALQDLDAPLHIAQECLYHRENRTGSEVVHDQVEQALFVEVSLICDAKKILGQSLKNVFCQLRNNRAAQHELERDLKLKEQALNIDGTAHSLNNFSRGLTYFGGIEKYDNTVSTPETWQETTNRNVQRSQAERARSSQLRTDTDNMLNMQANDCWNAWTSTNASLERRSNEVMEAKQRLQVHLHKVQREIFDAEKNIEQLRKAINDKSAPLKVAQTRLESRAHRTEVELCRDHAQTRLIQEVRDLQEVIDKLHRKLLEAEAQHQELLKTRSGLEGELAVKINSLFIDREKCMGMRRSYPITTTVQY